MIRTLYARNQAFRVQALAWSFSEGDNLKVELNTPGSKCSEYKL